MFYVFSISNIRSMIFETTVCKDMSGIGTELYGIKCYKNLFSGVRVLICKLYILCLPTEK